MATNTQLRNMRRDSNLLNVVEGAIYRATAIVYAENPATVSHAERLAWVKAAVKDPDTYIAVILPYVIGNATVQASYPNIVDGDVDYVVQSNLTAVATA